MQPTRGPPPVATAAPVHEEPKETWTTEEELFLEHLEAQCNKNHTRAIEDYSFYNKLSSKFNIPILIISALNALCAIALNDFLAQKYVSILNAVLSAGTGVLGSIQLYMKITEKMTNALRSSIHYKKLALKLSKELTIARKDRTTQGASFLGDAFAEFVTIFEQSNPDETLPENLMSYKHVNPPPLTPPPEIPSTPVRRIAERFKKAISGAASVQSNRTSLDESRRHRLIQQIPTSPPLGYGSESSLEGV